MVQKKDKNTFKFQRFAERVSNIRLDISHRVEKRTESPDETETFCYDSLLKWRELNCTLHFQQAARELQPLVQTLAQLVHHETQVIEILKKHLQISDSLALEPLLDFLVNLARDLQNDFYPYFKDFFHILVHLLSVNSQDSVFLEQVFSALGYLFKFLWRYMIKDMDNVYSLYSPLLSQQHKLHIQQFAAESFAFLARKAKDQNKLLDMLFSSLDGQEDLGQGVGFLCFEMIKGVRKQFHSQTDFLLPIMLSKLGPAQKKVSLELPWNLVHQSLSHTIKLIIKFTSKEHGEIIERCLTSEIDRLLSLEPLQGVANHLSSALELLEIWISSNTGQLVSHPAAVCQVLLHLLKIPSLLIQASSSMLKLACCLLISNFPEVVSQRLHKQLIKAIFTSSLPLHQLFSFSKTLLRWDQFREDVMPLLLEICQRELLKKSSEVEEVIFLLAEVVLSGLLTEQGGPVSVESKKGLLLFPKAATKAGKVITERFLEVLQVKSNSCLALAWGSLVCLPCIRPLDHDLCSKGVLELICKITAIQFNGETDDEVANQWMFVLAQAVQTYLLIKPSPGATDLGIEMVSDLLRVSPNNVHLLQMCCCILSHAQAHGNKHLLSTDNLEKVYPLLSSNLSHPAHLVRLNTLQILSAFEQFQFTPSEDSPNPGQCKLFEICLDAEQTPPSFHQYRDKLVRLRKLTYSSAYHHALPDFYHDVTARYLLGQLYLNFSPIWDPVIEVIKTHAQGKNVKIFWEVFRDHLKMAANEAEKYLRHAQPSETAETPSYTAGSADDLHSLFTSLFSVAVGPREDNRTDHTNFRFLLWKAMAEFPGVVEIRSRDIVPLLLRFIEAEYMSSDENTAPTQDVRRTEHPSPAEDKGKTEGTLNDIDNGRPVDQDDNNTGRALDQGGNKTGRPLNQGGNNTGRPLDQGGNNTGRPFDQGDDSVRKNRQQTEASGRRVDKADNKRHRKAATKSLCAHLNLFGLFHNPRALAKETQVRKIYLSMLTHRDPAVQKLAVACLLTYKFPYMEPYRDHVNKLLEDESFRDELALFTVDDGMAVVDPAHREELMPIVIRILYGKMQRWTGAGTSGKAGIGARRAVVLRFLASCPTEEMAVFMDLILAPFKHFSSEVGVPPDSVDLSAVVPLKIQQGYLTMMGQILHQLGGAVSRFLPHLLHICLVLLYACAHALQHRDQVNPCYISLLKSIRQLAIIRIVDFFEMLPAFDFSTVCEDVLKAAVWPQVESLAQETIQSPSPLLKLFHCWSKNPRYHPLLSRKPVNCPDTSIMSNVYDCLKAVNVNQSVLTMVMEMTENLLSAEEYVTEGSVTEGGVTEGGVTEGGVTDLIMFGSELSEIQVPSCAPSPSYSTKLVLPHLSSLLDHLRATVKTLSKSSKKNGLKRSALPKLELSVFSKISPFVNTAEDSESLIRLLLPFLYMRQREETENNTLRTIQNLLRNVESPSSFSKPLGRLFSQLNARTSRQSLCEVFQEIAKLEPHFEVIASIVVDMNSWDPKRIEEPNFQARVGAFSAASCLVLRGTGVEGGEMQEDTVSPPQVLPVDKLLPLLHNCLYFIHRTDDLSIRDSAVSGLHAIIRRVAARETEFEDVIVNCVRPSVKLALRAKNEAARLEFLGILSYLCQRFDRPCFTDMRSLCDKDPEADFFENMRHIQLHRRIRALRRLETYCQGRTLTPATLTSYMLPLVTSYLHDYSAAKDHNILTQAIATVGAIARCLPWSKYSNLLRQYLKVLQRQTEKQKTTVRIVVALLNAFHFNLSNLKLDVKPSQTTHEKPREAGGQETKAPDNDADGEEKAEDDRVADDDNDDDDDGDDDEEANSDVIDKVLAQRIYESLATRILPQLLKTMIKKGQSVHKLSHSKADDQDSALRVPIALAIVKLLQALPEHTLHLHLPGLLMKVCMTLKSRARDVRDAARDTLCRIAVTLGTKYLSFVLKEMRTALTRGYQLHVLGFTLHSLLERMTSQLSPGNLDHCLPEITEVLVEDLFGEISSEREVEKITGKLHEAKASKSQDSFEILAKFVGASSVTLLVTPLKQVLDTHQSHKISRIVEESFRRIGVGLQANESIDTQTMLVLVHGLTSERLVELTAQDKIEKKEPSPPPDPRLRSTDTYTIQPEVTRGGKTPEASTRTNAHVVVEFGLQLLHTTLKRGKVSTADQLHLQMLDPFVSMMTKCLQAKHTKVLTLALRCLCWIVKFPLPSLDKLVPQIAKLLFKLLKKYAMAGAKIGDNYEMVLSAFKTMTVIIREFKKYTIAQKHLQVLLAFVEEDIHDYTRQGTAFPLLRAILSRRLMVPEIHDVMAKVAQLSITGATPSIQQQCRQCMAQFMLDYPLGKKLQRNLEFYVSQLGYEHETGRESALEMLASIFSTFPEKLLFEYSGFFFVPLTTRLVNDDSGKCRKLTALTIKTLLQKLDMERRDALFTMVTQWLAGEKVSLRRLAAQVSGLFVEVEGKSFERRLPTVLPLLSSIIDPANYEKFEETEEGDESSLKANDHLLFNALTTIAKLVKECNLIRANKRQEEMTVIWESVESHLTYPHAWVRLVSCRLFGLLFAAWTPQELSFASTSGSKEFLAQESLEKVSQLCDDFCVQLDSPFLDNDLGDQVVKNLVFLAKVLHYNMSPETNGTKAGRGTGSGISLETLISKMERLATHEASQTPKVTRKRTCVLKWLAALAMALGKDDVRPYLQHVVEPIHRELEIPTTYKDPALQSLAQEVLSLVKGLVGREAMSEVYASLQHGVMETKEKRKRQRALEAVADPAESARRKFKRNLSKKETRKRKLDALKPDRKMKRARSKVEKSQSGVLDF
ncbi:small subunit processome component 20 homolog isoform X2 [Nematostella vectensis]|uniref:small subunit processome component 20 homolog isoform X2 n=1 Tax=Nematostella vectensis TaxID=45351 RepID=UPI002077666A|nr:small subunit processome component 20 homolog isoform X2 [Nematostella vectensis]